MSHFFKVLLPGTLRRQKLKIPPKFVKKYGASLPAGVVVLEDPNGKRWEVKLKKLENGEVWLCGQGWSDFVEFYSLGTGHLILFAYRASNNSHFNVVICDTTATEIDYPSSINNTNNNNNNISSTESPPYDDDDDDDHSVEILDDDDDDSSVQIDLDDHPVSHKVGKRSRNPTHHVCCQTCKVAAENVNGNAVRRVKAFESKNPFFWLVLKQTYVDGGRYMNLPNAFVKQHLKGEDLKVVLIRRSGKKTWSVQYRFRTMSDRPHGTFTSGWAKFATDNHLKVGDVCLFELIKTCCPEIHFHVRVFSDDDVYDHKHIMLD